MLATDAGPVGPRTQLLSLINGFEAQGSTVRTYFAGDKLPKNVGRRAAVVDRVGWFGGLAIDVARLGMVQWHRRKVLEELDGQVDWVYEHFNTLGSIGNVFQQRGIPWIVDTDALQYREAKARKMLTLTRLARRIERSVYHRCDALVCISDALKDAIVADLGVPAEKIIVRPNGVDAQQFDPARYEPIRYHDEFTVGFVGSLYAWQGIDLLLHAMNQLRDKDIHVRATIIGDGPARVSFEQLSHTLGLEQLVTFTGRMDWSEIPALIGGFDIAYSGHVPSDDGPVYMSPMKVYEYMAMATPVVASRNADTLVLLADLSEDLLFETSNSDDLERALRAAYQRRSSLNGLGKSLRTRVVENHSWTARIAAMTARIDELIEERSKGSIVGEMLQSH